MNRQPLTFSRRNFILTEDEYYRLTERKDDKTVVKEEKTRPPLYYNPMEAITVRNMKRKRNDLLETAYDSDLSSREKLDENVENLRRYLSDVKKIKNNQNQTQKDSWNLIKKKKTESTFPLANSTVIDNKPNVFSPNVDKDNELESVKVVDDDDDIGMELIKGRLFDTEDTTLLGSTFLTDGEDEHDSESENLKDFEKKAADLTTKKSDQTIAVRMLNNLSKIGRYDSEKNRLKIGEHWLNPKTSKTLLRDVLTEGGKIQSGNTNYSRFKSLLTDEGITTVRKSPHQTRKSQKKKLVIPGTNSWTSTR